MGTLYKAISTAIIEWKGWALLLHELFPVVHVGVAYNRQTFDTYTRRDMPCDVTAIVW